MPADEGGWFELVTAAAAGSRYRYQLDNGLRIADPAARAQEDDVQGPSLVVDPHRYAWQNPAWAGRPWSQTVLYELHVGTFSDEGTFDGVRQKLSHLAGLGVTAIELMPLADFAGRRNWGYDGVLPFAPDRAYGEPDDLKRLIDEAHGLGLMVFLDVVYNHFGPDGNYLPLLAPEFFTEDIPTPWGAAINYALRPVRDFVIDNALYWLEEYRFDGLRLDAVHAIEDASEVHILTELAETVRWVIGRERYVHLVLENDANQARYLERDAGGHTLHYDAQWNDDFHHVAHALLTGERAGYYADYADRPVERLARALDRGFIYQGEPSAHRGGVPRGEPSGDLPPLAFVDFLQNHDQIGNRAFGERLTTLAEPARLKMMQALLLLAPQVPLLFMGEEWGAEEPFLFFCDFHDELADAVREGRRREFAHFPEFANAAARARIPDPNADADLPRLQARLVEARGPGARRMARGSGDPAQGAPRADRAAPRRGPGREPGGDQLERDRAQRRLAARRRRPPQPGRQCRRQAPDRLHLARGRTLVRDRRRPGRGARGRPPARLVARLVPRGRGLMRAVDV